LRLAIRFLIVVPCGAERRFTAVRNLTELANGLVMYINRESIRRYEVKNTGEAFVKNTSLVLND
jgi:hypothetical protein